MMRRPLRLRTQLSLAMILTAVTALFVFIGGMVLFYIYLQVSWIESLDEKNRHTVEALMKDEQIDQEALTTLVSNFSYSWNQSYAEIEFSFLILFTLIPIIFSIIIGISVSRRISRPIEAVTEAASRVSDGALDIRLEQQPRTSSEAYHLFNTFNSMTSSLEQAEREATASAAAIAHELRTPLTILRGRLQGFIDGAFEPNSEMLKALIGQVDTLSHIVDDLATLSLISAGQYMPETTIVDIADEARSVLTSLRPSLKKEGIVLEEDLQPAKACVDPVRIRQALNALIENAIRYAVSGRYIRVETRADKTHVYLHVIDHGPGIAEADRERVFDRWWRVETSRTRAAGGSGLGLSIVRAIVSAHNGKVSVSDNPGGVGANFAIILPVSKRED